MMKKITLFRVCLLLGNAQVNFEFYKSLLGVWRSFRFGEAVFFPVSTYSQKIEIYLSFYSLSTLFTSLFPSFMPTMKEVDFMIAKLAQKYHFSQDEARRFLDLPIEVKSKPKPKPQKCQFNSTPCSGGTRGPSLYQQFVKAESGNVKNILMAQYGVSKLERGQLQKELGVRWKAMSDQEKAIYNK